MPKSKYKKNGQVVTGLVGGAVVGGLLGATLAEEGEEREGAVKGALIGGALGGLGGALLTNGHVDRVTNEDLFDIYNSPPDFKAGTRAIPEVMGGTPNMKEGFYEYPLPDGTVAYTVKRKDGSFARNTDFVGLSLLELVKTIETKEWMQRPGTVKTAGPKFPEVRMERTKTALIHFRMAYPSRREAKLGDLPVMFALHGVPCSNEGKTPMLHDLGRDGVIIAPSMISMGQSTMLWEYRDTRKEFDPGAEFDWIKDRQWLKPFMDYMISAYGLQKAGFQQDDWGTGIGQRYIEKYYPDLKFSVKSNPIHTDGYFVIEIGTFANASWLVLPPFPINRDDNGKVLNPTEQKEAYYGGLKQFEMAAVNMPKDMIGIEKYMVTDKNMHLFNRYTESFLLAPYKDVDYQGGRNARDMLVNFVCLALLCIRSARLKADQLLPKHAVKNPEGVDYVGIRGRETGFAIYYIWPMKDQMMPPRQGFETGFLTPHTDVMNFFVRDANHYIEWEAPREVSRIYREIWRKHYGVGNVAARLGDEEFVWKGDEAHKLEQFTELFGLPKVHDSGEMHRIYTPHRKPMMIHMRRGGVTAKGVAEADDSSDSSDSSDDLFGGDRSW